MNLKIRNINGVSRTELHTGKISCESVQKFRSYVLTYRLYNTMIGWLLTDSVDM